MTSHLDRKVLSSGNDTDYPKVGDEVTIEYTGWLYDSSKPDQEYKGKKYVIFSGLRMIPSVSCSNLMNHRFDSSVGRSDFKTQIGCGRVIQGIPSP